MNHQNRVHNFSAGPSALPEEVLKTASSEMLNYRGSGMSVMEMSHRSKVFEGLIQGAEANLRKLLDIPENYRVLFLQGGASTQFSAIPLNLLRRSADYVNTGTWSKKAIAEAKRFGSVRVVASSEDSSFTTIPKVAIDDLDAQADYLHVTSNNTIFGTAWHDFPEAGSVPLVADFSSDFLSAPIDVKRFGVIYAGAQKNAGIAGLTIVIIREDLISDMSEQTPTMLSYKIANDAKSLFNTPPCFSIYMSGLIFDWLLAHGGLESMQQVNQRKAQMLYDFIDQSQFYKAKIAPEYRSIMNVTFGMSRGEDVFLVEAEERGLMNLKGHRSVGGIRASIYNGVPEDSVAALVAFMKEFEAKML